MPPGKSCGDFPKGAFSASSSPSPTRQLWLLSQAFSHPTDGDTGYVAFLDAFVRILIYTDDVALDCVGNLTQAQAVRGNPQEPLRVLSRCWTELKIYFGERQHQHYAVNGDLFLPLHYRFA